MSQALYYDRVAVVVVVLVFFFVGLALIAWSSR